MSTQSIPNGYKQNAVGHLVPVEKIGDLELLKDDLVTGIINQALNLQTMMMAVKAKSMTDIEAFMKLAAEQYDTVLGGEKGNVQLLSFDGRYKVIIAIDDNQTFDEKLTIAKQLIDECIIAWTQDSNDNVRAIIQDAFQVDKAGNLNKSRIFGLLRLKNIDDPKWAKAMEALKDSIQVVSSKRYIRLYQRVGDEGKYQQISLDMAGLVCDTESGNVAV
jgi:hypothetical protein